MIRVMRNQLPDGMRLLPDEQIEIAFEKKSEIAYFTNKRVIIKKSSLLPYEILPYSTITRYTISGKHLELYGIGDSDISTNNRLKFALEDIFDVEYVLAKNIL